MLINQHILDNLVSIDYKSVVPCIPIMDDHTYQNWVKIKATFEASGNTNNMFYKRACEIVHHKKDPLSKLLDNPSSMGYNGSNGA